MSGDDALAVIKSEPPKLSVAEAREILHVNYDIGGDIRQLVSERDQNFHVRCENGEQFTLKIANVMEERQATDFQIKALLHLEAWSDNNPTAVNAPKIIRTQTGESHLLVRSAAGEHVARVVTYLCGIPLGTHTPEAPLARSMGAYLAVLGIGLRDFDHPGCSQPLLWDVQQALQLRGLDKYIEDGDLSILIATTLDEFEHVALRQFGAVRTQVIHSDFNPDNVLLDEGDSGKVAGVIDFGDMVHAPLIVDVAVGASYMRPISGNPLSLMAEFLAGYHRVTRLDDIELDMLFTLIKTRLAATVAISKWRQSERDADDPYLNMYGESKSPAAGFLARVADIPRRDATQALKQVCASVDAEVDQNGLQE